MKKEKNAKTNNIQEDNLNEEAIKIIEEEVSEEKRQAMYNLIDANRQKGYIDYKDIEDGLDKYDLSEDEILSFYDALDAVQITIVDSKNSDEDEIDLEKDLDIVADDEDEDTSSSKSSKSSSKSTTAPKSTPKSNSSSKSSSSNSSSSSKSNSSNDDELSEDELNDILPFLQSDSTESNS